MSSRVELVGNQCFLLFEGWHWMCITTSIYTTATIIYNVVELNPYSNYWPLLLKEHWLVSSNSSWLKQESDVNLSRWIRKISAIQLPCKLRKSRQLVQTSTMPPMSSCQVCSMHVPYAHIRCAHIRCTPNIVTTQKIEWLHNSHATTHVSVMCMLSFDSH